MKQPFRTVAELPLVEVPKKEKFDWWRVFSWMPLVGVVTILSILIWAGVCDDREQNRKAERQNKETADLNHQIDIRNAYNSMIHEANLHQCNDWKSMDKESCAICLEGSSVQNDKRCADVSRWYIK